MEEIKQTDSEYFTTNLINKIKQIYLKEEQKAVLIVDDYCQQIIEMQKDLCQEIQNQFIQIYLLEEFIYQPLAFIQQIQQEKNQIQLATIFMSGNIDQYESLIKRLNLLVEQIPYMNLQCFLTPWANYLHYQILEKTASKNLINKLTMAHQVQKLGNISLDLIPLDNDLFIIDNSVVIKDCIIKDYNYQFDLVWFSELLMKYQLYMGYFKETVTNNHTAQSIINRTQKMIKTNQQYFSQVIYSNQILLIFDTSSYQHQGDINSFGFLSLVQRHFGFIRPYTIQINVENQQTQQRQDKVINLKNSKEIFNEIKNLTLLETVQYVKIKQEENQKNAQKIEEIVKNPYSIQQALDQSYWINIYTEIINQLYQKTNQHEPIQIKRLIDKIKFLDNDKRLFDYIICTIQCQLSFCVIRNLIYQLMILKQDFLIKNQAQILLWVLREYGQQNLQEINYMIEQNKSINNNDSYQLKGVQQEVKKYEIYYQKQFPQYLNDLYKELQQIKSQNQSTDLQQNTIILALPRVLRHTDLIVIRRFA